MSRLAIVSAMHEEMAALAPLVAGTQRLARAGREFLLGEIAGQPVILVRSGIGKVAAATTTALLLDTFDARAVLFTGVAGGLGAAVRVGDLVVGDVLLQHDMDASPLFPRWEVPLTGRARFAADAGWSDRVAAACAGVCAAPPAGLAALGLGRPSVHRGLVISGDRFVSTRAESDALRAALPDALAVEMEGAAVAQVCHDFGRPLAVVRSISDRADDTAHGDFGLFLTAVAAEYSRAVVLATLAAAGAA